MFYNGLLFLLNKVFLQFQNVCSNSKFASYCELWVRGARVEVILERGVRTITRPCRGPLFPETPHKPWSML